MSANKWVQENLFGGRGKVTVELALDKEPAPFECVLRCSLAPKASVGTHVQEECGEVLVVLAGRGKATVDGRTSVLKAGAVVPLALGSTLALANTSPSARLNYLIIKARP